MTIFVEGLSDVLALMLQVFAVYVTGPVLNSVSDGAKAAFAQAVAFAIANSSAISKITIA